MGCFVIIVQISNARLLFVFLDLFAKDFELKLHEVDLLLQVYDILVRWVDVWVIAELTWSLLFFTMKRPDWAMWELPLLWLSIAAIIATLWRISRLAAVLLLPYVIWVTVAGFLNYANVQLNGPF